MRPAAEHEHRLRVYYEDTDLGGVVYYANYLKFFERARSEYLRALGIDQKILFERDGLGFVVRRCVIDYRAPARFDDELVVRTSVSALSGASVTLAQRCARADEAGSDVLLTEGDVVVVLIDRAGRPQKLSGDLRARLDAGAPPQ